MNRSLRSRLTLLYTGLFAALFTLFSVLVYGALAHSLNNRLDERVAAEADTAASLFADEYRELGSTELAAGEVVVDMKLNTDVLAILQADRVLASTPGAAFAEFSGPRYRSTQRRLTLDGKEYRILAATPLAPVEANLSAIRRVLILSLPLTLALAGLGAWLLATRALAPLRSVAEQAHRITEHSLHTRLQAESAAAELEVVIASFNDLLSRLDRSFDAMRRFVADASHELRTPVSVIRGEADVALSRERSAAEYRDALALVLDESRRMSILVDDLLNLARADSGRVRLEVREFYLNELLAECCRNARAPGIAIECAPGPDLQYRGDEPLLRRLILNLLDNAARYTPAGGRVTASLETSETAVCIRISDTGPGIAPEHLGRVFERFYRVEESRSRGGGGAGLGLSIVKWIAEAHGGSAACASIAGEGSTFTVTLPLTGVAPTPDRVYS